MIPSWMNYCRQMNTKQVWKNNSDFTLHTEGGVSAGTPLFKKYPGEKYEQFNKKGVVF